MNRVIFQNNFKNGKYYECITDLRKESINILENSIKEKDCFFSYSTTKDLYNKSKQVLSDSEIEAAHKLYSYDIMEENDKFVLDDMLDMYKNLIENT